MIWEQLSIPWRAAAEMAWEAFLAGCVPIGAVIADPQERVVAAGRNRMYEPRGTAPRQVSGVSLAHAEVNAILALDPDSANPRECVLYTTTVPCPQCAGALVMANLRHLRYASRDPWAGSADLTSANAYVASKKVRVEGPSNPVFENLLVALHTEFLLREGVRRGRSHFNGYPGPVVEAHRAVIPAGVALGERLFREQTLQLFQQNGVPARQVFGILANLLEAQVVE